MADINHVVLVGRLTRDAELKYTQGGAAEQDGQSRSKVEIIANNLQLLGSGSGSGQQMNNGNQGTYQRSNAPSAYQARQNTPPSNDGYEADFDNANYDNIPF